MTSIDEVAQEQEPVDLSDRPSLVARSQAAQVGGEVAGFDGCQAPRSKVAVGGDPRSGRCGEVRGRRCGSWAAEGATLSF